MLAPFTLSALVPGISEDFSSTPCLTLQCQTARESFFINDKITPTASPCTNCGTTLLVEPERERERAIAFGVSTLELLFSLALLFLSYGARVPASQSSHTQLDTSSHFFPLLSEKPARTHAHKVKYHKRMRTYNKNGKNAVVHVEHILQPFFLLWLQLQHMCERVACGVIGRPNGAPVSVINCSPTFARKTDGRDRLSL